MTPEKPRSISEAIRLRPGMYVGGTGRAACMKIIAEVVNVLVELCKCRSYRDGRDGFAYHAFLTASVSQSRVGVMIDFHREEAPDFSDRARRLSDAWGEELLELSDNLDFAIVRSLTEEMTIVAGLGNEYRTIVPTRSRCLVDAPKDLQKGSFVYAQFLFFEGLDASAITEDYMMGYLEAVRSRWLGLVLRQADNIYRDLSTG